MKPLARQNLDVMTRRGATPEAFGGWRGQFLPEFKPIEFEGFENQLN